MNQKKETLEKEKESLNKSDAVALKGREAQLTKELEAHDKILADKKSFLAAKEAQYRDVTNQIKEEEREKYRQYRQYLRDIPETPGFPDTEIMDFAAWREQS